MQFKVITEIKGGVCVCVCTEWNELIMHAAHEDDIWSVAWSKSEKNNVILTGSVDDSVKLWLWYVCMQYALHAYPYYDGS